MINVNDLILFSLIDTPEGVHQVKGFNLMSRYSAIIIIDNGNEYDSNQCHGIPISPDWLERCGFVDGEIRPSYKWHIAIRPYQTATQGLFPGEWEVTLLDSIPHALGQTIKYLHQLQNLYFALTGEELNVKL